MSKKLLFFFSLITFLLVCTLRGLKPKCGHILCDLCFRLYLLKDIWEQVIWYRRHTSCFCSFLGIPVLVLSIGFTSSIFSSGASSSKSRNEKNHIDYCKFVACSAWIVLESIVKIPFVNLGCAIKQNHAKGDANWILIAPYFASP